MPPEDAPPTYSIGTHLFLRVLGVVFAVAFVSAWAQIDGLVGPAGLLPAGDFLRDAKLQLGPSAYWQAPSLCWIFGTGYFLKALCLLGVLGSAFLFVGIAPALSLGCLWALYLSLCTAGQLFFDFQWDSLLLETGLVAVFLAPWTGAPGWKRIEPPPLARAVLTWLLMRLMLLSGIVKLTSGDPLWRSFRALTVHFQTQPLPTPLAWYVHQLPEPVLKATCALMFAVELIAPFGLLASRRIRHVSALALIGLQVAIALTGNYTFFNFLTIALCLPSLDDAFWGKSGKAAPETFRWPRLRLRLLQGFAAASIALTSLEIVAGFSPQVAAVPAVFATIEAVTPLRSFNTYGLFAVMTPRRPELIFEGSNDGQTWSEYGFRHKPGELTRAPDFVAPFQPRLDWQLWFAALGRPNDNAWVLLLGEEILKGNPRVLALLGSNPFPSHPPRWIRIVRYDYSFTDSAARATTGQWWRRTPTDLYVAPFSLKLSLP